MKVRQGWSGEVEPNRWAKFDIELEEDDLRRVARQHDIDPAALPGRLAFLLLEVEAEMLVLTKLIGRYGYPQVEGQEKIARLKTQKDSLLAQAKAGA